MSRPSETPDSSATEAKHSERQHSMRGTASVIMGLVGSPPIVVFFIVEASRLIGWSSRPGGGPGGPGYGVFIAPEVLLMIAWFYLSPFLLLAGVMLGIAAFQISGEKWMVPVTGITLSTVFLILWFLFYGYVLARY
jgi:hypothetical protein